MERVFKVYKENVTTDGPVTILRKKGEPFNEEWKRKKFLALGYQVIEL
jgi:hypothetical protein